MGAAVFVHPWDMLGKDRMNKYWLPWLVGMPTETAIAMCSLIFGGVLEKLPKLKIAFAHGGGTYYLLFNINYFYYLSIFNLQNLIQDLSLKLLEDLITGSK